MKSAIDKLPHKGQHIWFIGNVFNFPHFINDNLYKIIKHSSSSITKRTLWTVKRNDGKAVDLNETHLESFDWLKVGDEIYAKEDLGIVTFVPKKAKITISSKDSKLNQFFYFSDPNKLSALTEDYIFEKFAIGTLGDISIDSDVEKKEIFKKRNSIKNRLHRLSDNVAGNIEFNLLDREEDYKQLEEIQKRFGKSKFGIRGLTGAEIEILNRIADKYDQRV